MKKFCFDEALQNLVLLLYKKIVKLQQLSIIKDLLAYDNKNIREFSEQNFLLL